MFKKIFTNVGLIIGKIIRKVGDLIKHFSFSVLFIWYKGYRRYYNFIKLLLLIKLNTYEELIRRITLRMHYVRLLGRLLIVKLKGFFGYFIGKILWKIFIFVFIFLSIIIFYNLFLSDYGNSLAEHFEELWADTKTRRTLMKYTNSFRGYIFIGVTGFVVIVFLYFEAVKGWGEFENKFVPEEGDKETFMRVESGRDRLSLKNLRKRGIKRRMNEENSEEILKEIKRREEHTKVVRDNIKRHSEGLGGTIRYWEHYLTETEALLPPLPGEKNGEMYQAHVEKGKYLRQLKIDEKFYKVAFKDLEVGYDRFYTEERKLENSFATSLIGKDIVSDVEEAFPGGKLLADESNADYILKKQESEQGLLHERYMQIKARQKFLKDFILGFLENHYTRLQLQQEVLKKHSKYLKLRIAELKLKNHFLENDLRNAHKVTIIK